jgi:hypothetical protein
LGFDDEAEVTEGNDERPGVGSAPARGWIKNALNDGTDAQAIVGFYNIHFHDAETSAHDHIAEAAR